MMKAILLFAKAATMAVTTSMLLLKPRPDMVLPAGVKHWEGAKFQIDRSNAHVYLLLRFYCRLSLFVDLLNFKLCQLAINLHLHIIQSQSLF